MRFKEFSTFENLDALMRTFMGSKPADVFSFGNPQAQDTQEPKATTTPFGDKQFKDTEIRTDIKSGLPVNGPITSGFGRRARGMHYGTDFGVPVGTPVVSPSDGVVWMAGWGGDAGNMVAINSGNVQHKLMHLSQVKVKAGDTVKRGQVVGLSGNTGYSTGPHLHWSKYIAGQPVDPMKNVG